MLLSCTVYEIKVTFCVDYSDHISVVVVICCISCPNPHCTLYWSYTLYFVVFVIIILLTPLALVLLIYPVTDVGAYKLISFLLQYVSACTVHCSYVTNTLLALIVYDRPNLDRFVPRSPNIWLVWQDIVYRNLQRLWNHLNSIPSIAFYFQLPWH